MTVEEQAVILAKRFCELAGDAVTEAAIQSRMKEARLVLELLGQGGNFNPEPDEAAKQADPVRGRKCVGCGTTIGFVTMAGTGRTMALDLPGKERVVLVPGIGGRHARAYVPHEVTCPAVAASRKGRAT